MAKSFTHRDGTVIALDSAGMFHAERDGVKYEAGSLAGMARKLDKKPDVEPFDALDPYATRGELVPLRVVGIAKQRTSKFSRPRDEWKCSNGYERRHVYTDTPECRAVMQELDALRDHHDEIRVAQEAAAQKLQAKLEPFMRKPPQR